MDLTDEQFIALLRNYLRQFSEDREPVVPLKRNNDGTIDRVATLRMRVYEGMPSQ